VNIFASKYFFIGTCLHPEKPGFSTTDLFFSRVTRDPTCFLDRSRRVVLKSYIVWYARVHRQPEIKWQSLITLPLYFTHKLVRPSVLGQLWSHCMTDSFGDGTKRCYIKSQTLSPCNIICYNLVLYLKTLGFLGRTFTFRGLSGIEYAHWIDLDVLIPNHILIDMFELMSEQKSNDKIV
jgi:hypothetical protein